MARGVESKREKVVNVVIRPAPRREDRPNSARRDDGDVAADWIIADDPSDRSTERDRPVWRNERTADGELHAAFLAGGNAARHRVRIDEARPDRGRASRSEVRIREKALEHEGNVPGTAGRRVIASVADEVRTSFRREASFDAPIGVAGGHAEREIGPRIPVGLGESSGFALDRVPIGAGDDDGGAAPWLIGPGVADPHGGVDDPCLGLDRREAAIDAARRLVAGAGPVARQQDGYAR